MATQQLQPKAVLRLLLRAVDKHITSVAGNQQWRQHVLQQFRQGRDADAPAAQRLLLLAQEYANLVTNIAQHQELLDTYNIGVDPDRRNKEMVEKTAARVGFRLPDANDAETATAAAAAAGSTVDSRSNSRQQEPQEQQQQQQPSHPQQQHQAGGQQQQDDGRTHTQQSLSCAAEIAGDSRQGWQQQPQQHAAAAATSPPAAAAATL